MRQILEYQCNKCGTVFKEEDTIQIRFYPEGDYPARIRHYKTETPCCGHNRMSIHKFKMFGE